jgi:hypothetical protein
MFRGDNQMKLKFLALLTPLVLGWAAGPAFADTDTSVDLVAVTQVSPGNFSFSEDGFSDGASVTGTFSGTDLDSNGQISSQFGNEVTAFSMSFSGNSVVPAFSANLSGLIGFAYTLNGGALGDHSANASAGTHADGIFVISTHGWSWSVGPGPLHFCSGSNPCGQVSAGTGSASGAGTVPEPAAWVLMTLGVAGLGACLRTLRRDVIDSAA